MLRITENFENDKTIRLRLDGSISPESCRELEKACLRYQGQNKGKIVLLDMSGVVFMTNDAATNIVRLRGEQLRIINCSPFIETLLNTAE
jgi:anti-anti-sigma regulatory factor